MIAPARVPHVHFRVGVDDLVAERADTEVGALREEHDAVSADCAGPGDEAAVDGPQTCDEARDAGFAGAVGAGNQEVLAGVDDKG